MPRKKAEKKSDLVYLTVVVGQDTKKALDTARGKTPLSRYVRALIEGNVARKGTKSHKAAKAPASVPEPQPS